MCGTGTGSCDFFYAKMLLYMVYERFMCLLSIQVVDIYLLH